MSVSLYGSGQTVIQVQSFTTNTTFSTTSATPVATPVTVSITPQSTTSKILVIGTIGEVGSNGSSAMITINRSGTNLALGTGGTYNITAVTTVNASGGNGYNSVVSYLDSPSTTSSLTYTLYLATEGGLTATLNKRQSDNTFNTSSTITVLEISGS